MREAQRLRDPRTDEEPRAGARAAAPPAPPEAFGGAARTCAGRATPAPAERTWPRTCARRPRAPRGAPPGPPRPRSPLTRRRSRAGFARRIVPAGAGGLRGLRGLRAPPRAAPGAASPRRLRPLRSGVSPGAREGPGNPARRRRHRRVTGAPARPCSRAPRATPPRRPARGRGSPAAVLAGPGPGPPAPPSPPGSFRGHAGRGALVTCGRARRRAGGRGQRGAGRVVGAPASPRGAAAAGKSRVLLFTEPEVRGVSGRAGQVRCLRNYHVAGWTSLLPLLAFYLSYGSSFLFLPGLLLKSRNTSVFNCFRFCLAPSALRAARGLPHLQPGPAASAPHAAPPSRVFSAASFYMYQTHSAFFFLL